MTHHGIRGAKKILHAHKYCNNNKDYRNKPSYLANYCFSSGNIPINYILRTKHGICLNVSNLKDLNYRLIHGNVYDLMNIYYEEHTEEENKIIQEEINLYYNYKTKYITSRDLTHSDHSKKLTRDKNRDRDYKWNNIGY